METLHEKNTRCNSQYNVDQNLISRVNWVLNTTGPSDSRVQVLYNALITWSMHLFHTCIWIIPASDKISYKLRKSHKKVHSKSRISIIISCYKYFNIRYLFALWSCHHIFPHQNLFHFKGILCARKNFKVLYYYYHKIVSFNINEYHSLLSLRNFSWIHSRTGSSIV